MLRPEPSRPGREQHPRRLAVVWLSFVALNVLLYLFYLPWEEWWYVRFLMPSFPPMLALTAAALWALAAPLERLLPGAQGLVAAMVVAAVSWHGVSFSLERGAQLQWVAEQRYKTVGAYVDATLPHRAVLICMQHSGSARFYSGRITVRYDLVEPPDLAPRGRPVASTRVRSLLAPRGLGRAAVPGPVCRADGARPARLAADRRRVRQSRAHLRHEGAITPGAGGSTPVDSQQLGGVVCQHVTPDNRRRW